ncbi:hypothetical protein NDU88_001324 [Pleurodeles waltl]|uniref:Beta/gamma crystallin 'Greek key' domain-containing protein n=1 Tax=Pleurodeles waltl TaxID=8319 RepID=A0AAV7TIF6_PLEWA|nr:hypothetical protein NDU88_001324 [Pleurodeles waltl]
MVGKITFYEERNFMGRSYECSEDSPELYTHFLRCNSIRVGSGNWMLYERPGFLGYQYFLRKGEYPSYQHWMGFNDYIRSCRMIPAYQGSYKLNLYENFDFLGRSIELQEDCPSLYERFQPRGVRSCGQVEGFWIFYEHPHYRGRQYLLWPGQYRRYSDWGAQDGRVSSIRRVTDF